MIEKGCSTVSRLMLGHILTRSNVAHYIQQLYIHRPETYRHCINVGYLVAEITYELGVIKNRDDIVCGALLHDIGKLMIPEKILLKPDRLTNEEWCLVQRHPEFGYDIVKDDPDLSKITKSIILRHHEKFDGSGYPSGLCDLPREIQIVTVCDIYDALTEKRSYGKEYDYLEALQIMSSEPINNTISDYIRRCPDK